MSQPVVLIWSIEHNQWWAQNSSGYTSSKAKAGRYTLAQAIEIVGAANEGLNAPNEAIVFGDESDNALITETELRTFLEVIIQECCDKHCLHPLEENVSADYNVELTFSVHELRKLLMAQGAAWGAGWWNKWVTRRCPPLEIEKGAS